MEKVVVRQLVRNTERYANQKVEVSGWIRTNRDQKSFGFIALNDGTHFNTIQIVYEKESLLNFEEVAKYRVGSAINVKGILVETPQGKQPFEIKALEVMLEGDSPKITPSSRSGTLENF